MRDTVQNKLQDNRPKDLRTSVCPKLDATGIEVETIYRVCEVENDKPIYTVNLYHTNSSMLLNGRDPGLFIEHVGDLVPADAQKLDSINAEIKFALNAHLQSEKLPDRTPECHMLKSMVEQSVSTRHTSSEHEDRAVSTDDMMVSLTQNIKSCEVCDVQLNNMDLSKEVGNEVKLCNPCAMMRAHDGVSSATSDIVHGGTLNFLTESLACPKNILLPATMVPLEKQSVKTPNSPSEEFVLNEVLCFIQNKTIKHS